jgi:hypothetical protein
VGLTTSTASIAAVWDETLGFDNLIPPNGWHRNAFWFQNTPLAWGKNVLKFTFDYESIALKFTNMTPAIPKHAKVTNAILRGTAAAAGTGAFYTFITILAKDGYWDQSPPTGPQWRGVGVDGNKPMDADVHILNPALGTLADTNCPGGLQVWSIRTGIRYLKVGQGVTIATAGNLGYIDIAMKRTATAPAGNVWCEVYGQDADGLADTLLATSDTRPVSDAPTTIAIFRFTFSGAQQISLSQNQDIVAVVNGDYTPGANNVQVMYNTSGDQYAPGFFQVYGQGWAFDDQNYPLQDDFRAIATTEKLIYWVAPNFVAGTDYDTPDISEPLQRYISSNDYSEGDPIGAAVWRSDLFFPPGDVYRQWANFAHATYDPVRLIVEWRRRNRQVIGGFGPIPPSIGGDRVYQNFIWRISNTAPTNELSPNRFRNFDPQKKTPRAQSGDTRAYYLERVRADENSAATDMDRREAWHDYYLHVFYPTVYPWRDLQKMIAQDRHDLVKTLRSLPNRLGWSDEFPDYEIGLYERQRESDTTETIGDVYEMVIHWRCKIREEEQ